MLVQLQEPRIITVAAGAEAIQAEVQAANVLDSRVVFPMVRLMRDSANSIASGATITFNFRTAALLSSADDSTSLGLRFVDIPATVYKVEITGVTMTGATHNGATYTASLTGSGGKLPAIENPGGLILWRVAVAGSDVTFKFEIDLVCRP